MKKVRSKKTIAKVLAAKSPDSTSRKSLARRYQEIRALRRKLELAATRPRRAK